MSDTQIIQPRQPPLIPPPVVPVPVAVPAQPAGGMGASHAVVGLGAGGVGTALTTWLIGYQGFGFPQGLDPGHAGALAFLIVSAGMGIYKTVSWLIAWKYPTAPKWPTS